MVYLEDNQIRLRAPEPEDLQVMYEIENHSSLWEVGCTNVPYSRYVLKQYIAQSANDIYTDKQVRMMIERKADGKVLGCADLTGFEPLHGRAEIGVVVSAECRNQGMGARALALLCRYAFGFLHLHQLVAFVACDNTPCLRMFAKCGYLPTHTLKGWIRTTDEGDKPVYKDAVMIQCFGE